MNSREKTILIVMILLFTLSVFMFYYQNIYKTNLLEQNKVEVLIAKSDIEKNTELNKENIQWIKIDKNLATKDNVFKKDDVLGKKISEKIFEGEFINKKRIKQDENKERYNFDTYVIDINPDFATTLNNGDLVKVYVQTIEKVDKDTERINNLLVFDKKEIVEIVKDGEQNNNQTNFKIKVTDKEALAYYNAKKIGTVIAMKYEADMDKPDYKIPIINITE